MPAAWSRIVLWLLVMEVGISLSAGLYEGRIVVPGWLSRLRPMASLAGTPRRQAPERRRPELWAFVTTRPAKTLITLARISARPASLRRAPPLVAGSRGLAALCDRVFTFAYFIPTMVSLMQRPDSTKP